MKSYKDLIVWQKSMDLVIEVYRLTAKFPSGEKFGLISQMRRAAISIPSNISEGFRKGSKKFYVNFLQTANASASELETQIEIAKQLGYLKPIDIHKADELLLEVLKILNVLIRRVKYGKQMS